MVADIEPMDFGPVRAALTEVKPQIPGMPAEFWDDIEILLIAWHRGQRWRMVDLPSTSVGRYAQLLAAFFSSNVEMCPTPA